MPKHLGTDRPISRRALLSGAAVLIASAAAAVRRAVGNGSAPTTEPTPSIPTAVAWWSDPAAGTQRQIIVMSGSGHDRTDHPVEVNLAQSSVPVDGASLRVVEVDTTGRVVDANVPYQYDPDVVPSLVILAGGNTPASTTRTFCAYFDPGRISTPGGSASPTVRLEEDHIDEGQQAFLITTRQGTYSYQTSGASLSSLVDRDGHDWLSYHDKPGPGPTGARGFYRGLPNFHFPDGNFHPGFEVSTSNVLANGPLRVIIRSTSSAGGTWEYETTFFADFARATVTKAASPYWFLYEGTPGGESSRGGVKPFKVMRADGTEFGHRDDWSKVFKDEAWVSFRSPGLGTEYGRSFFLAANDPQRTVDSYHLARDDGSTIGADDLGAMTVFGFGRSGAKMTLVPDETPNRFTFGLFEPRDSVAAAAIIRGAYRDLSIALGAVETRPGG